MPEWPTEHQEEPKFDGDLVEFSASDPMLRLAKNSHYLSDLSFTEVISSSTKVPSIERASSSRLRVGLEHNTVMLH
jgi:hypothetical protein